MKQKILYLTGIAERPNQKGQEKLQKAIDTELPKIDYEALGLRAPKGEIERDEQGNILLDDDEFEYVEVECSISLNQYLGCVDDLEFGSRVYTTSGIAFRVLESCDEVTSYIEFISRNLFERLRDSVLFFFRRIKWKLQGRKEVDLEELFSRPENQPDYDPNS